MQRTYLQTIKKRILEPRKFIQVILGPRQVGKTTLITQALHEVEIPHLFVTADNIEGDSSTWLKTTWSRVRVAYRQTHSDKGFLLIIDEAQKIENWSEVVKREWDMDTFNNVDIKLVILGSSSLLIKKGLTESLTGRFEVIPIPHWSYEEMHEAFGWNVNQYIWYGGYPGPATLIDDEARWKQYISITMIETSISKDVLMLSRIDKPALLRRLFDIGCRYSAQIVSLSKIQGELNETGNLTTLSNYLNLLNAAQLIGGLEKYSSDLIRQRASKPKFQVYNNALINAQIPKTMEQVMQDPNLWGRLVESAIGCHLQACSAKGNYQLYYWNDGCKEVDFVLQRGTDTIGIEVKSGKANHISGMKEFEGKHHPKTIYLVGADGIPLEEFFQIDPATLL